MSEGTLGLDLTVLIDVESNSPQRAPVDYPYAVVAFSEQVDVPA